MLLTHLEQIMITAQIGGSARCCHQRVDHALRSEPPADPRARASVAASLAA